MWNNSFHLFDLYLVTLAVELDVVIVKICLHAQNKIPSPNGSTVEQTDKPD